MISPENLILIYSTIIVFATRGVSINAQPISELKKKTPPAFADGIPKRTKLQQTTADKSNIALLKVQSNTPRKPSLARL
jgi:hypothetical protein